MMLIMLPVLFFNVPIQLNYVLHIFHIKATNIITKLRLKHVNFN
jgi:hypothetical protein